MTARLLQPWLRALPSRLPLALLVCLTALFLLPGHASALSLTQQIGQDIIQTFTDWVAQGATWLLGQVVQMIQTNTAIDLSGAWFMTHYRTMIALESMVMLPMLFAAAVKAAFSGSPGIALKAAFLYLPLAFFCTFIAVPVVNMLLQIVDAASQAMTTTLNADYLTFSANISTALNGGNTNSIAAPFVIFLCAVAMVIFGLLIFIELLFRNAAIYATAVFIPLAFATLVFPSTRRIVRRLIETLLGLILLKFFIVTVFAVGVSALASQATGGNFGTVLAGLVVLILAAVLPNLLIGLLPLAEGAAMATIASRTTVQQVGAPTSNQIYANIRRQNESQLGAPGGAVGGFIAGAAGGATLAGAAQSGHIHMPSAALVGTATAGGGGLGTLPGGPGPGGIGPVGVSPSGGGTGGSILGMSTQRVSGVASSTAKPPATPAGA